MDNKEIYRKTLGFSLRRLAWDILAFLVLGAAMVFGYFAAEKTMDRGLAGLGIGLIVGLILLAVILRYASYSLKAGQIAMMTRGITEGVLPENVVSEGRRVVKERFATVAAFFAVTGAIKGVFQQIGRGLTRLGDRIGGEKGSAVGSVISYAVQIVVAYLCECCLGWVFYRREQPAAKATCEGAVLFFRHGRTLARNMGRVFGIGLLSLLVIGGAFTAVFFSLFSMFPAFFVELSREISTIQTETPSELLQALSDPSLCMLVCAGIAGVILWNVLHSVLVRPFVLVGVLRNYLQSGMEEVPTEASFAELDSKSPKFAKLHAGLAGT